MQVVFEELDGKENGIHVAADIMENYGIHSETDVSVLDQGDYRCSRSLTNEHCNSRVSR